jgi:hypothetical protein
MRSHYQFVGALLIAACPVPKAVLDSGIAPPADAGPVDAGREVPLPDHFVELGALHKARLYHSATVLPSGRVLIVGGEDENSAVRNTAELVDVGTGQSLELQLPERVTHHTATLLKTGQVLISGGGDDQGSFYPSTHVTGHCWLFDPDALTFTATGALNTPRSHHTATLLNDGRVLVAGGGDGTLKTGAGFATATASAEVYDPSAQTWTSAGAMSVGRVFHTASLMPNGHVLIAAGVNELAVDFTSVDDFDPVSLTFSPGPPLSQDRFRHAAAVLTDGTLLIAAGKKANVRFLDEVERLAPGATQFVFAPPLALGGNGAAMVALPESHAVFVGGYGAYDGPSAIYDYLANVQRWEPDRGGWRQLGPLNHARTVATVSVLPSGQVLVAGGMGAGDVALASLELSQPCAECEVLKTGVTGTACSADGDCGGTGRTPSCRLTSSPGGKPYLGGFCTAPCTSDPDCPLDAICGPALPQQGELTRVCWPRCAAGGCRSGYSCYEVDGVDGGACWLNDTSTFDAGPPAAPGLIGSACASDDACQPPAGGTCFPAQVDPNRPSGFPGGYCSADCTLGGSALCGDGGVCLPYAGAQAFCFRRCSTPDTGQGECRDGEVCRALAGGGGYCLFACQYNKLGACGNAPCDPSGYCR